MEYKTVRGMQDFLPERARKKKFIERVCLEAFEKYGFSPLETPIVEELDLLTAKGSGGAAIENEIYAFEDKGGRKLGLRFDLTVPVSRVVASNKAMKLPFKRYQIGRVYRYDRPQAKRYREFTQADIDVFGSNSVMSEFELIAVTADIMQKLKLDFYIIINSRKLLENLVLASGVPVDKLVECFRAIDKAEKIGWNGVREELERNKIESGVIDVLKANDLSKAEALIKEKGLPLEGIEEVRDLLEMSELQGLEEFVKLDLALARGLEYYTGMVFEVKVEKGPSVGGGGRYDKLVELYGGQSLPATGISFGIERLVDSLESFELPVEARIFVMPVSAEFKRDALRLTQSIRGAGVNAEIDLMDRSVSKNLDYANRKGIPFVVVLGEREIKSEEFGLKELGTGKESRVKFSELEKLKGLVKN